jgi:preprotein translocase subunit SecE
VKIEWEKFIPYYRDIKFTMPRVSFPSGNEVSKESWIVGVIMLFVGLLGFAIHALISAL